VTKCCALARVSARYSLDNTQRGNKLSFAVVVITAADALHCGTHPIMVARWRHATSVPPAVVPAVVAAVVLLALVMMGDDRLQFCVHIAAQNLSLLCFLLESHCQMVCRLLIGWAGRVIFSPSSSASSFFFLCSRLY